MNSLKEFLEWRASQSRPSIHFKLLKGFSLKKKGGFNQVGGLPTMPKDYLWPTWKDEPLSFVAQIDFATLPRIDGVEYPSTGQMYFFFHSEQPGGLEQEDAGSAVVLFAEGTQECVSHAAPPMLAEENVYKPFSLSVSVADSFPSTNEIETLDLTEQEWDRLEKKIRFPDAQMFGWAVPVQSSGMEVEAEMIASGFEYFKEPTIEESERAKEWILLFQINSIDYDGMCWGDLGMLYFWIRKQDLAEKRFDRVWCFLQ